MDNLKDLLGQYIRLPRVSMHDKKYQLQGYCIEVEEHPPYSADETVFPLVQKVTLMLATPVQEHYHLYTFDLAQHPDMEILGPDWVEPVPYAE